MTGALRSTFTDVTLCANPKSLSKQFLIITGEGLVSAGKLFIRRRQTLKIGNEQSNGFTTHAACK
jgi:hypothetical protein